MLGKDIDNNLDLRNPFGDTIKNSEFILTLKTKFSKQPPAFLSFALNYPEHLLRKPQDLNPKEY